MVACQKNKERRESMTIPQSSVQSMDSARLDAWMVDHVANYSGPLIIEKFAGGQSNPTFLLKTPSRDFVLRRQPGGPLLKGAHAVDREYKITSALHTAGFPVARPWALCTDTAVIGSIFYVMEHVEGRIFWDTSLPEVQAAERPAYFDAMNTTIAALHQIDPLAIGLEGYGRAGNYFQRQITRWTKQYQDDEIAGRIVDMDRLVAWLPNNIPPGEEVSIVHGDFRCDNLMFHPTEPKVVAVLDWELSTFGHPLADFAYHLMMYRVPPTAVTGLLGHDLTALNIPSESDYVATYCRRTGRSKIADLDFYLAFNMFRLTAIIHGIHGRMVRGNAANANAAELIAAAEPLAAQAWALAEGIERAKLGTKG